MKMTKFDKIMKQIWSVPLVSIYPQVCGICGKINQESLCKKCEIKIKKQKDVNIIKENIEVEDRYFNELIYFFKYEGLIRKLILDYKKNKKAYLYKTFVNFILKEQKVFDFLKCYDMIIPVPISKKRYKERGYNQSYLIAKEIAKRINLKLVNRSLYKTKNIIEQSKLNREQRLLNIQDAYMIKNMQIISGKRIILIDDIYTTGSTVNECSKVLRQAKPQKIGVLTVAKD